MEKRKEFIINSLYIAIICVLVYIGINYLFGILMPFVLAFVFAYFARKISKRFFKEDKPIYRTLVLIVLYLLIIGILGLLIVLGINKLGDFIKTLPNFYRSTLEPYITSLEASIVSLGQTFPSDIQNSLSAVVDGAFESLKTVLSSALSGLVNLTTSIITKSPDALITIIVMFVSSFYIVNDYENIAEWIDKTLPYKNLLVFYEVKDFVENVLLKIISSYISIMFLTFLELFIGLSLFGIANSGMWAAIIALLDILPILGVGTVLIPWGISSMITGKFLFGLGIIGLYVVISIVRNIVEPKLVGTDLGLHPLVTLISMIVGLRLFNAVGMFGLPLTLSFFMNRKDRREVLNQTTDK